MKEESFAAAFEIKTKLESIEHSLQHLDSISINVELRQAASHNFGRSLPLPNYELIISNTRDDLQKRLKSALLEEQESLQKQFDDL